MNRTKNLSTYKKKTEKKTLNLKNVIGKKISQLIRKKEEEKYSYQIINSNTYLQKGK